MSGKRARKGKKKGGQQRRDLFSPYPLEEIKQRIKDNDRFIPERVLDRARRELGFSAEDIERTIMALEPRHFYKTMASESNSYLILNVYKINFEGERIYLHFRIDSDGKLVIDSFHGRDD